MNDVVQFLFRVYGQRKKQRCVYFSVMVRNCVNHYIKECELTKDQFKDLGKNCNEMEDRIWSDEIIKKGGYCGKFGQRKK